MVHSVCSLVYLSSIFMMLVACSHQPSNLGEIDASPDKQPKYSVLFLIHADADYIYFDKTGKLHNAAEETLNKAKLLSQQMTEGEAFVFYQGSEKKKWWGVSKGGKLYHFFLGKPAPVIRYSRSEQVLPWATEMKFYDSLTHIEWIPGQAPETMEAITVATNDSSVDINLVKNSYTGSKRLFFYFGHEIPYEQGMRYSESLTEQSFTLRDVVKSLTTLDAKKGLDTNKYFSLVALSSCYGGSPFVIQALCPFSDRIIASPNKIPLRYLDFSALKELQTPRSAYSLKPMATEISKKTVNMDELTKDIAVQSYENLSKEVETTVTISIYNTKLLGPWLESTVSTYLSEANSSPSTQKKYVDCKARIPNLETIPEGALLTFHRNAVFEEELKPSGLICY